MKQRKSELLDVPYFHVVFTLPARDCRHRLPEQGRRLRSLVQGFLADNAHDCGRSKRLGVKIGFTSVLHTWAPR